MPIRLNKLAPTMLPRLRPKMTLAMNKFPFNKYPQHTFAHSRPIVNDKGSDIFVVGHCYLLLNVKVCGAW
jgi:hypothetical protein